MSKKYRPYLSLQMMERIVELCNICPQTKSIDFEIKSSLKIMILKARHEITKPSYIPLVDKLGLEVALEDQTGEEYRFNTGLMSSEEELIYTSKLMERIKS